MFSRLSCYLYLSLGLVSWHITRPSILARACWAEDGGGGCVRILNSFITPKHFAESHSSLPQHYGSERRADGSVKSCQTEHRCECLKVTGQFGQQQHYPIGSRARSNKTASQSRSQRAAKGLQQLACFGEYDEDRTLESDEY